MRRPQFSLKTLLWLMAVVAAFLGGFLGGAEWQKRSHGEASRPTITTTMTSTSRGPDEITKTYIKEIMSDGSIIVREGTMPASQAPR
jgi:hypothetical protein